MKNIIYSFLTLFLVLGISDVSAYEWTAVNSGVNYNFMKAWAASEQVIFVTAADMTSGGYGRIMKYDNGVWTVMTKPDGPSLSGLWGVDANNVWAGDDWGFVYHYDGNVNNEWTVYDIGNSRPIFDIHGTDANNIYVCGSDNNGSWIFKYNGSTWTPMDVTGLASASFNTLKSIYAISPTDVWVVGGVNTYSGSMAHYNGTGWTVTSPGYGTSYYNSIDGNADYMIAVGARGTSAYYNGTTWQNITSEDITWRCVKIADNGEAIVSGSRGIIRIYDDGWFDELYLNHSLENFNGVAVFGTKAWVVGNNGRVYETAINSAPCVPLLAGDVNCDQVVDYMDLSVIADEWLEINQYLYPLF